MRQLSAWPAQPSRQRGAGLVEWLVSVVIATLGLLALAGLQAYSLRYAKLSQYRAIATQLAHDITERIRANRTDNAAASSNAYAFLQTFADQRAGAAQAPTLPLKACDSAGATAQCSQAEMAQADLDFWRLSVRALLPEGSVFLDPDAVSSGAAPATGGASATGGAAASVSPALDLWLAWSDPADVAGGARATRECPAGLVLDSLPQVRCLFFRVLP